MLDIYDYDDMNILFGLDGHELRIEPFKADHLKLMELKDVDLSVMSHHEDYFSYIDQANDVGTAYTFFDKEQPINCWGILPYWNHVVEFWMIPDKDLPKHKMKFHKGSLKFFDLVASQLKLHRLQCTVCSSNVVAHKWIKAMYFTSEGVLRKFGTDQSDWEMYARIY